MNSITIKKNSKTATGWNERKIVKKKVVRVI